MTLAELRTRTLKDAGEDPDAPVHYTGPMAIGALNRSLRLFVLRSLAVERSGSLTLTAATAWYHIRTQLADVLQCVVSQQLIPKMNGKGRVAAMEVMISNNAIRNHIRESKTFQIPTVMQTNGKFGMKTMDDALFELYQRGEISQENALFYAQDRTVLSKRMV